eukprot:3434999-Alexandrium_andersonii.AAC.1
MLRPFALTKSWVPLKPFLPHRTNSPCNACGLRRHEHRVPIEMRSTQNRADSAPRPPTERNKHGGQPPEVHLKGAPPGK